MPRKSPLALTVRSLALLVAGAFFLFPVYWMVATSLKHDVDTFAIPPKWLFEATLENFRTILFESDFLSRALNSLVTGTANVLLTIALALPAAYSTSRYNTGGRNLMFWFLSLRMLPPVVGAVPLFVLAASFRLVDSPVILPILYLTVNLPLAIWMLKSFLDDIPRELDESARVDGCSTLQTMLHVVIPILRPGLFTTAVFVFVASWNEFLLATVFTRRSAATLPVAVAGFVTDQGVFWGLLTAAGTLASIPPIVLLVAFQRHLVRGLTMGAVKG